MGLPGEPGLKGSTGPRVIIQLKQILKHFENNSAAIP